MSYKDNLLRYALRILESYKGELPLQAWLKNFFRENPQMGSRDRKQVAEMVYCYFRLGHSLQNITPKERIVIGLFLSNNEKQEFLEYLHPVWHAQINKLIAEKIGVVQSEYPDFQPAQIFPWMNLLSANIDETAFGVSFLIKPRIFVRVRPGKDKIVKSKLESQRIDFKNANPQNVLPFTTYSFSSATKLDDVLKLNEEVVIQDLSSQETAKNLNTDGHGAVDIWDCCSGSGGKSILFHDLHTDCRLTVSDMRESILVNLKKRFLEAGIKTPSSFRADLTDQNDLPKQKFDFIIADLPCTGSGTWSRTPDALYYFNPEVLDGYQQRQEKILNNIGTNLKHGGVLVYITCSVFAAENESVVNKILKSGHYNLESLELIGGYSRNSDSMFVARFRKKIS